MFELKQLRYFIAVAEELSFRRAAERLHITQPPLSLAIKNLEEVLNVKLFIRNTHGVKLTRSGEFFLSEAVCLLNSANNSLKSVRQVELGEIGMLHIGYSASAVFSSKLTHALSVLLKSRPFLDLKLHDGNAHDHLEAIRCGSLDAAIIRADMAKNSAQGLKVNFLSEEPLYVLMSHENDFSKENKLFIKDLLNERILLQPASEKTFLRYQIENLLMKDGLSMKFYLEVPDISSMLCFAKSNIGVAILPKSVAMNGHGLAAIPLADVGSSIPLTLVSGLGNPILNDLEELMFKYD